MSKDNKIYEFTYLDSEGNKKVELVEEEDLSEKEQDILYSELIRTFNLQPSINQKRFIEELSGTINEKENIYNNYYIRCLTKEGIT